MPQRKAASSNTFVERRSSWTNPNAVCFHPCASRPDACVGECAGVNPMDGYTPSVPTGKSLDFGSDAFQQLENQGREKSIAEMLARQ